VFIDYEKVNQALSNIFENSLKHTSQGFIKIEALVHDGTVKIIISDTGIRNVPSISHELSKKFAPHGDITEAAIIGNSLGLYVAKQIIEANKGEFSIYSSIEKCNTKFYVTFIRVDHS
jgi:signal transduction histidine kinase